MGSGQEWWAHQDEAYLDLCKYFSEEPLYVRDARNAERLDSAGRHYDQLKLRYKEK